MSWLKRVLGTGSAAPQSLRPDGGDELLRAGFDCESRGDMAAAERHYGSVAENDPAHAAAMFYLGRRAAGDHRLEEAIALFQRAADECPDDALFHLALGDALGRARRFEEALIAYGNCRALQAEATVVTSNYAGALIELNRREEARVELERLLEIVPYASEVHFNLGGIYREYCRTDEAIAAYTRALENNPGSAETYSNLLLELNMSVSLSAEAVFAEHRRFGEHFARRYSAPVPDRSWPRRLRIGYVSCDFRLHVVSFFMEPILTHHDHARFEIFCYHVHGQKDHVTQALRPLADHWVDCEELSDAELAERIRADRIDILVDLGGHTAHNRLVTFAQKPAPVQATYLGYPNTTGLPTIDYRITDAVADPPGDADRLNTERLIRLPDSYFCFRPGPDAPPVESLPAEAAGAVTFGCFSHFAKVSEPYLETVARVLDAVPRSRFILKGRPLSFPEVAAKVRRHFERMHIDPARIELRGWEPTPRSHLRIYGSVDIALDSFPYSGATTTCEALWMGVPVVSVAGDRHAGRMCASILTAVGLGEWVARDRDQFVEKSVALSSDLGRLAELRRTMRDRMQRSPLMDELRFTRNLEQCYVEMWQRSVISSPLRPSAAPQDVDAMLEDARGLKRSGKPMEAVQVCRSILAQAADHPAALELLWDAGFDAGAPGTAIDPLVRAIEIRGDDSRLHYMLGCALEAQGKAGDAIAAFRRAIELEPGLAKAHNNLGCALEAAGRLDEAARSYSAAIGLEASLAQARYNLGNIQSRLGIRAEAIDQIKQALALEPRNAEWRCRLGELQYEESRLDDALASFRTVVEIDPSHARAQSGLGNILITSGRVEEALVALRKALELDPSNSALESQLLAAGHFRAAGGAPESLEKHIGWARRHARGLVQFTTGAPRPRAPGRRVNLGYVAHDFFDPRIAPFLEPVVAAHDRRNFNVFCYSNSLLDEGTASRLLSWNCTPRDISTFPDLQALDRIRADSIDILVDLAGHTNGGRPLLFARRPAPVQIAWLGYPGTTGLRAMDYRITDAVADPQGEADRCYTEKLVRLPNGFLCYAPPADAPEAAAPAELGAGNVMFASFNDLATVTPEMLATWSAMLRTLPQARIRLQAYGFNSDSARRRVIDLFAAQGIAIDRIDLRPPESSLARNLAAYHDVDVALDVFPYGGRASICEALWMGIPVVTLAGEVHASRVGASILRSVGLQECVAVTAEQYAEIALRLARDVPGRQALRHQMRERMRSSPLLDAARFARDLESAYLEALSEKARTARSVTDLATQALRLHIGGKQRKPGWKTFNVQPGPEVDFVGDCARDLGQFKDASVAEIYASYVLEHLGYQQDLPRALAEFHRILQPGGTAKISALDFELLCRRFLDPAITSDERFLLIRMAFGGQNDPHDLHRIGLTFELLSELLLRAGFAKVDRVAGFDLFEEGGTSRFAGMPSLNVVARK